MRGRRKKPDNSIPSEPRDKAFCERWLEHFDVNKAYAEAGFKGTLKQNSYRAHKKLARFMAYLEPMRAAKAVQVGKQMAINQDDVIQAMARVAFLNPKEYFVQTDRPLTRAQKVKSTVNGVEITQEMEVPVEIGGQVIYQVRARQLDELTPEQLSAVEVVHNKHTGEFSFRIPDQRVRLENRRMLGQNLGMFLDKLVLQHHQHLHQHAHLDVSAIPPAQQNDVIRGLLPYVGAEFAQFLGFSMEEIEEAMRQVGSGKLLEHAA